MEVHYSGLLRTVHCSLTRCGTVLLMQCWSAHTCKEYDLHAVRWLRPSVPAGGAASTQSRRASEHTGRGCSFHASAMVIRERAAPTSIATSSQDGFTTGICLFAECRKNSAKAHLNSAKPLPRNVLGKAYSAYTSQANRILPRAICRALKAFAELQTRILGKEKWLDGGQT